VRTPKQLERVLKEVEQSPGIVLYTIVKSELIEAIERRCRELKVPSLHVLQRSCAYSSRTLERRRLRSWRPAPPSMPIISGASTR